MPKTSNSMATSLFHWGEGGSGRAYKGEEEGGHMRKKKRRRKCKMGRGMGKERQWGLKDRGWER